jgi:transposase-like protein
VELWLTSGKSATQVAEELGIDAQRLSAWKPRFAPPPPGGEGAAARSAARSSGPLKTLTCGARTNICASNATF